MFKMLSVRRDPDVNLIIFRLKEILKLNKKLNKTLFKIGEIKNQVIIILDISIMYLKFKLEYKCRYRQR